MLTLNRLNHLLTYDKNTGEFTRRISIKGYNAGSRIGTVNSRGYLIAYIDRQQYRVHQLVWFLHHGEFLKELDHIDRDRLNNKIENLRPCTRSQNIGNSRPRKHKYKGVSFCKSTGRWRAVCAARCMGRHDTIEEAALAYNIAAIQHFGEFAYLNQVDQT